MNNAASGSGSHLFVDDCGRIWFALTTFGIRIYDPNGVEIANWNLTSSVLFDILILPDYVVFVTIRTSQQIIRYDPQVSCS